MLRSTIPIVLGGSVITTIRAWSSDSHKIVAAIASNPSLLSETALDYILDHFPDTDTRSAADALVPIADWADSIPASDDYHFTHTPFRDCQPFDLVRDCGSGPSAGRCLVTGLQLYFDQASDLSLTAHERRAAIQFLVHLVADATQPLHTGFREDAGGNAIILAEPADMSLHEFWDHGILDSYRKSRDWGAVADQLVPKAISRQPSIILPAASFTDKSFASEIVTRTVMDLTCRSAYVSSGPGSWIESGFKPDRDHTVTRTVAVINQLVKAGVWLAQVLNAVATKYNQKVSVIRAAAKQAARDAFVPTTIAPEPAISTWNYFSVIALHFDPEAHLFTDTPSVPVAATRSSTIRKAKKTVSTAMDDDALLAEAAAENAAHIRFGIQMKSLILTKLGVHYRITSAALINRVGEIGFNVQDVVLEEGAPPVRFMFDGRIFPAHFEFTGEIMTTVFSYLAGVATDAGIGIGAGGVKSSKRVDALDKARQTDSPFSSDERAATAALISASVPEGVIVSAKALTDDQFRQQSKRMVVLWVGDFGILSRADLLRNSKIERLRVNRFGLATGQVLYVDIRVHDGPFTVAMAKVIDRMSLAPSHVKLLKETLRINPKIGVALAQLEQVFSHKEGSLMFGTRVVLAMTNYERPDGRPLDTMDLILLRDYVHNPHWKPSAVVYDESSHPAPSTESPL